MQSLVFIKVDDVSFSYESLDALRNVSFEVRQSEFVGIIGPNGAGKSTLLNAISRILRPRSGAVMLNDLDVQEMDQKELAKVLGFVAQDSSIPFRFSVLDFVMMGRNPHLSRFKMESAQDLQIAEESMTKTGVHHLAERAVTEISGGERQRALIARALTQTPRVLLLDEPTLHLDVGSQFEIMDLLRGLSRIKNLTVIAVYHDFNLAARYCDRIILMNKGRVEAVGSPKEILTKDHVKNVFNIEVHIGYNYLTDSVYAIPLTNQKNKALKKDWTVHVICGGGSGALLIRRLTNEGWGVTTGVLNLLDTDQEVATSLGIQTVTEAPFSPITEEAYKQNVQLAQNANAVVVTDFLVGRGNVMNLKVAKTILQRGVDTILIGSDTITDRDYTEGEGTALVKELLSMGALAAESCEQALNMLESLNKDRSSNESG